MADYLTRVAIAGARTGIGGVRPVRSTAALPSFAAAPPAANALAIPEESFESFAPTVDALPGAATPRRETGGRGDELPAEPAVESAIETLTPAVDAPPATAVPHQPGETSAPPVESAAGLPVEAAIGTPIETPVARSTPQMQAVAAPPATAVLRKRRKGGERLVASPAEPLVEPSLELPVARSTPRKPAVAAPPATAALRKPPEGEERLVETALDMPIAMPKESLTPALGAPPSSAASRQPRNPTARAEPPIDVSAAATTISRLIAPNAGAHRVRMPPAIRETIPAPPAQSPPPEISAAPNAGTERVRMPRGIREAVPSLRRPPSPAPHAEPAPPPSDRTIWPISAPETRPRAAARPPETKDEVSVGPVPRPLSPLPSEAAAPSATVNRPRSRVTIGRLELQVRQPPPPAPRAPVRVASPPAAADVIEARFLDRLRWKP